jgi:molecular chaperone GrpE
VSIPDSGDLTAKISEDVLREAQESLKHDGPSSAQDEVAPVDLSRVDPDPQPPAEEVADVQAHSPDPAAEDLAAAEKELESLRAQLEFSLAKGREMMGKIKESHEKMLRAVADLDNFKKRAQREKEEVQKFGAERLLKDLLPVIDNLDRALDHASRSSDYESLRQGVAMTRKLFEDSLGRHGVKGFSSVGQPFDPHLHEAMQQVETADVPPNHVVSELAKGYMLNERLIRPALVAVAKAPERAEPESQSGSQDPVGGNDNS